MACVPLFQMRMRPKQLQGISFDNRALEQSSEERYAVVSSRGMGMALIER